MVQRKANRPQRNKRTLKEVTIKTKRLKTLKATELTVQGAKVKPKILIKEDI